MALTRIYLDELARIQKRLAGLFEQALLPAGLPAEGEAFGTWSPPVNLVDTGGAYRLEAELPGVERESIDLSIEDRKVLLAGRVTPPGDEATFLRMERSYGAFRRTFQLDEPVDPDAVSARLERGVLTVTIPKRPGEGGES